MAPAPFDYWLIWAVNALFPVTLAAIGGYLAFKSLGPKLGRSGFATMLLVAMLGLAVTGLLEWRAFGFDKRRYAQETQKEHDSTEKQNQLTTALADARSKLDSIIILVKNGPDDKHLLATVSAMAQRTPAAQPVPPAKEPTQPAPPSPPTNLALKRTVDDDLSRRLNQFDIFTLDENGRLIREHFGRLHAVGGSKSEIDKEPARYEAEKANMLSERNKQFAPLRAQALILRTQLLSRLPPQPNDDAVKAVLDDGNYNNGSAGIV